MFDWTNVTTGTNGDRKTAGSVTTIGYVAESVQGFETIFDTVDIESFDGGDVEGVSERLTNCHVAVETTVEITHHTRAASVARTIEAVDVFVTQNGAGTEILAFTLLEKWGVVENWLDG